jgi:PAS domain S-box-containing protein
MDEWLKEIKIPMWTAAGVFVVLFVFLILISAATDLSLAQARGLLFLACFACCYFVAKNVYDKSRNNLEAEKIRRQITEDVTMYTKDLYTQLYQNSPVPYLLIDHEGIIGSANVAAARIFGFPLEKLKGLNVFSRLRTESLDHLDLLIEKFHSGVAISDETVRIEKVNGNQSWALLSLFNFEDNFGWKMGMLTLVDITKQKQVENAKSEFVSLASHQLRTPIAGILWSAELLEMDGQSLTKQQKKYVDRLLVGVKRMALLIDDFLRVSRFELGTFQPEYGTINLTELFENIIQEQAQTVSKKNLEIKTFFDKSVRQVVTDQNLLRMILSNLYSNAVKYTRDSGTIHIGFSQKEDEIVISIADNGMGIPITQQEHIFSKLFRASNAVRNIPDGTGLGLYIVKAAVTVLNGRVSFISTENVGTTFEVNLPYETEKTTANSLVDIE